MTINIMLFGHLTDITGTGIITLDDIPDTNRLISFLHNNFPAFANSKYVIAVDKKVISENTVLTDNCTVALLPPFSGG